MYIKKILNLTNIGYSFLKVVHFYVYYRTYNSETNNQIIVIIIITPLWLNTIYSINDEFITLQYFKQFGI